MAWIELHQSLPSHRKLKRLVRELRLKKNGVAQAVGHLSMLWLWSIDNAPSGDFSEIDPIDIADAAGWDGDPEAFLSALESSGFVEERHIHDWYAYIGKLIDRRDANARRNRESRARSKDVTSASRAHHDTDTSASRDIATVPNRTQPNRTQPNQEENDGGSGGGIAHAREDLPDDLPAGSGAAYCRDNLRFMTSGNYEELRGLMDDGITDELTCLAVDEACANGGRSWGYVRKVLNRWLTSGIRSVGDVMADRARYEQKQGPRDHPPNKGASRPANDNIFADMLRKEMDHESRRDAGNHDDP